MAYHIATKEQLKAMNPQEFSRQYSQLAEWLKKNKGCNLEPEPQLPRDTLVEAVIGAQTAYMDDFVKEELLRNVAHWGKRFEPDEVIFSTGGSSRLPATA